MVEGKSRVFVDALTAQSREFVIVGVAGKIGAGAVDVAEILTGDTLVKSLIQPALGTGFLASELREFRIIQRYVRDQREPFTTLTATSVMLSFLLNAFRDDLRAYRVEPSLEQRFAADRKNENAYKILESCLARSEALVSRASKCLEEVDTNLSFGLENNDRFKGGMVDRLDEGMVGRYLREVNSVEKLLAEWGKAKGRLRKREYQEFDTFVFCFGLLPALVRSMECELRGYDGCFTSVFQRFGNNIRAFGAAAHP